MLDIITEEQNCSIPQRNIFNNLVLIRDATKYNKEKNTSFYILQIGQEKAFDQNFLFKSMKKMSITQTFSNFIKILYNGNTFTITNNGYFSHPIQIQRELRQASPLSLPLYVIQGEIITNNINHNETIKGIKVPNYTKQAKLL